MVKRIILTEKGATALKDKKNTGSFFEGLRKASVVKIKDEIEYKKFCSDFISSLEPQRARKLVRSFCKKGFITLEKTPFQKVKEEAKAKGLKVTKKGKVKVKRNFVNLKCTGCKRNFRIYINKENEHLYTPELRKTWKCSICRNASSKKEVKGIIKNAKKLAPTPKQDKEKIKN